MWRIVICFISVLIAGCATRGRPQATDQTTAAESVIDILWQWEGTDAPNDACVVTTPQRYTIRFLPEGKVQVKLDCNSGGGSYTLSAGKLSFGPLMSTRRACEPDSLDGRYMKDLRRVITYYVQDGKLYLVLSGNGGVMYFRLGV